MFTMLGLIIPSYPHFNFLVILRNYGLRWKAKGYCCHGSKNIFFLSLKNSISETSGKKIILTALAEKIKFKYEFLQFYQLLFMYCSILTCKDALQWTYPLKYRLLFFSSLCRLSDIQNISFKIHE